MAKRPTRGWASVLVALQGFTAMPAWAQEQGEARGIVTSVSREIDVSVGDNVTLSAARVRSFTEGAPGVADVKLPPGGDRFVITGRRPGTTTLLLIKNDGTQEQININVFQRPMQEVEAELRSLLGSIPGIGLRRVGARFFIEGGVSQEAELARIEKVASLFPGQVVSLVVVGGAAADRKINVRVDFFFVQYDRNKSHAFGIQYPGSLGGAGIGSFGASYDVVSKSFGGAQAVIANQPLPGLDIAASKGWAKVLKQSSVVTSNGTQATFTSGGEQNYAVATGLTSGIQAIPFGTDLTVLPRFDPKTGDLEITLSAEVADLTAPVAGGTALPARNRSTLSSVVSLKLGQSLVLSGIRTQSEATSRRGLPLLMEIPILGYLFGSEGLIEQDTEGAIFVVPSVLDSLPVDASRLIQEALRQFSEFDGDLGTVEPFQMLPAPQQPPPVIAPAAAPNAPAPATSLPAQR